MRFALMSENSKIPAISHPPSSDSGAISRRRRIVRRLLENSRDWIGRKVIRKPRIGQWPFPLRGERTKGEGERKTQIKLIEHPPSSQPSPQGEGETFAASLKNLRLDWPDGLPEKQKRELAVPSSRGRRLG
jgi:hypothetical protein